MKKSRIIIALAALTALCAFGFSPGIFSDYTRVGYIESEEIMKRYYDWQQAQQRIDGAANQWKKELVGMQNSLKMKEDSLEKYRLIWSAPEKEAYAKAVTDLKGKVQEFWTKKFGPGNSEYQQLNAEVMKPIYEKVFGVIADLAKQDGYDYVFDKTGEVLLLYANPAHDLTRDVMDKLGIKDTAGAPNRAPAGSTKPPVGKPGTTPPGMQSGQPGINGQQSPFGNSQSTNPNGTPSNPNNPFTPGNPFGNTNTPPADTTKPH